MLMVQLSSPVNIDEISLALLLKCVVQMVITILPLLFTNCWLDRCGTGANSRNNVHIF